MSAAGPLPPPSGLARSLRRRFDALQAAVDDPPEPAASPREPKRRTGEREGLRPAARERFTNRLARYLGAEAPLRSELLEPLRGDVALIRDAGEAAVLADAALALAGRDGIGAGTNGEHAAVLDPLLPILLAPEVADVLGTRDDPRAAALLSRVDPARRSP